ncbi:MAG: DUF4249 family protein [Bacteroidota bacterium]
MRKILFIAVILIIAGCEKQTTWDLQQEPLKLVVVDAILTDEVKTQTVKLTKTVSQLNENPLPLSGATVRLSDGDSSFILTEKPVGSGLYCTKKNFAATSAKTYSLLISADDGIYTAKAKMIQGSAFAPLRYSKNKNNQLYHIDWIANTYNAEKSAMFEIIIDWSKLPAYSGTDSSLCTAKLFYYTLTTLDVSEIFAPELEKISFPAGSIISESRYSLSPDFETYLRAMLSETNWRGGLFDSAPASVPTNLSEGATGFFAACAVTKLSMTVTP